jgi:hypothetical protein
VIAISHAGPDGWEMIKRVLLTIAALALAGAAEARDPKVPHEFQRTHPCPSTGRTSGACPGYVRDHVVPLCKGGPDSVSNMQWQTVEAGKAKDKVECK